MDKFELLRTMLNEKIESGELGLVERDVYMRILDDMEKMDRWEKMDFNNKFAPNQPEGEV